MTTLVSAQMRAFAFIVFSLLLGGCVESLRSSSYRLSFPSAPIGMPGIASATSQIEITERLRAILAERGFTHSTPCVPDELWYKRGVSVFWETNAPGSITLRISSTHRGTAPRRADRMELELLRMLAAEPRVRVAFVESSQ